MIWLALLATIPASLQFGDPIGNVSEWIRSSDNVQAQANGKVLFKVIFNPQGMPDRCIIVQREGDASIDALVCELIFKRFRSHPSRGADGQPTYMIMERSAVFTTGKSGGTGLRSQPLTVTDITQSLAPKDDGKRMALAVAVNAEGGVLKCAPTQWAKKKDISLAEAACRSLPAGWKAAREFNTAGEPIAYLRGFNIEFRHPTSACHMADRCDQVYNGGRPLP